MNKIISEKMMDRLMSEEKVARRLGRCRPLLLALWDEIEKLLRDDWPLKSIWKALVAEGIYSGCYSAFCANVRKILEEKDAEQQKTPEGKEEKKNDVKPPLPSPQPQLPPPKQDWSINGADWKPGTASDESLF